MALIGPRPLLVKYLPLYTAEQISPIAISIRQMLVFSYVLYQSV